MRVFGSSLFNCFHHRGLAFRVWTRVHYSEVFGDAFQENIGIVLPQF